MGALEGFDYPVADGLYATITSMESFEKPKLTGEKTFKLKGVPGFKQDLPVRALLQDKPAPLAVILLGLGTRSKDPLARLWQQQAFDAGCHVLAFDSVFRRSFNERSQHGVPGNLEAEARAAAEVIDAFTRHPEVQGKVTRVGLLGASYGGMLALNIAKFSRDGRIPVKIERVKVFSPPVSMRTATGLLDRYFDEDRSRFALLELGKLKGHKPVPAGQPAPFDPALMRAGIAYVFREDLEEAIACASEVYERKLEPLGAEVGDRGKWTDPLGGRVFSRYYEEIVFPYWREKGHLKSLDELNAKGDLRALLPSLPEGVQIVLAADDPLNDPKELNSLKQDARAGPVILLPRGGHLGYVGSAWAKSQVQSLFK
ncbi:MAG: alpha/beta fold hydrolase [Planctomycetes bacterium]|nr:alpha/beta fold hydrolase [Planctomycetota bacterium]